MHNYTTDPDGKSTTWKFVIYMHGQLQATASSLKQYSKSCKPLTFPRWLLQTWQWARQGGGCHKGLAVPWEGSPQGNSCKSLYHIRWQGLCVCSFGISCTPHMPLGRWCETPLRVGNSALVLSRKTECAETHGEKSQVTRTLPAMETWPGSACTASVWVCPVGRHGWTSDTRDTLCRTAWRFA